MFSYQAGIWQWSWLKRAQTGAYVWNPDIEVLLYLAEHQASAHRGLTAERHHYGNRDQCHHDQAGKGQGKCALPRMHFKVMAASILEIRERRHGNLLVGQLRTCACLRAWVTPSFRLDIEWKGISVIEDTSIWVTAPGRSVRANCLGRRLHRGGCHFFLLSLRDMSPIFRILW